MVTTSGDVKQVLNEQFARIAKAVAHPKRLELLDLLGQGERSVEALATATGMTVRNASAQLQVLRQARLVEFRKEATRVYYRLGDDEVGRFLGALRDLARVRLSEVDQIMRDYFAARDEFEPIPREELVRRARAGDVVVLDVRPGSEYAAGHIPGAVSIPLDELESRLGELPARTEVVAYCRGPYCVMAPEAVARLRHAGRRARRLEDGLPEWRLAGLPVAAGSA
jgi:rhodanese-related sulfurtransferase/DNA-binding transcriptional ArsR family regulator